MPETDDDYMSTSERLDVDTYLSDAHSYLIYLFHIGAYEFATSRLASDAQVLDYGCGTGYGSHYLAESGRSVVGADVSKAAIKYAAGRYRSPSLEYVAIRPVEDEPLPFPNGSFDAVISFQVIEHVSSVDAYLREATRVLKPGGRFLCVTPDRATRLFRGQRPWNRWHLEEFNPQGLATAVARYLDVEEVMGMTAPAGIIGLELRRTRLLRLVTLPFTFPFSPERWRVAGLEALRKLSEVAGAVRRRVPGRGRSRPLPTPTRQQYQFGPGDIRIAVDAHPSINIVLTATRPTTPDRP